MGPESPNPQDTSNTQFGLMKDAALFGTALNNFNQTGPFGSTTFSQDGFTEYTDSKGKTVKVPKFSLDQTLDPAQQELLDAQTGLNTQMTGEAGTRLDTLSGNYGPSDFSAHRDQTYDTMLSRFDQDFERDRGALETRLKNQGIFEGSEAWNSEMERLGRQQTDARNQAYLGAGQEQSRLLSEERAGRGQTFNEAMALSGNPGATLPAPYSPYGQSVTAPDYQGAVYQDYANQRNAYNNNMTGLFGLGSSMISGAFGLSDRRAKKDIKRVGKTDSGTPIYKYRYKGSDGPMMMGVMAQDVKKKNPDAVRDRPDGFMEVNYAEVN